MREAVDEGDAIVPQHHHRLARAIADALERIGECFSFEPVWLPEHLPDGAAGECRIIKWKFHVRGQYTVRPEPGLAFALWRRLPRDETLSRPFRWPLERAFRGLLQTCGAVPLGHG